MSFTKDFDVADDAWTVAADTGPGVLVQLKSPGPILVYVGQSAPAASVDEGVIMVRGGMEEFVIDSIESGDSVYLRAKDPGDTHTVGVIGSGEAPA